MERITAICLNRISVFPIFMVVMPLELITYYIDYLNMSYSIISKNLMP